jgi:hypothetical protein
MRCVLEDTPKCLLQFSAQNVGGGLKKIRGSPANSIFVGIDFLRECDEFRNVQSNNIWSHKNVPSEVTSRHN